VADWQAIAANLGGAVASLAAAWAAYQARRESQAANSHAQQAKTEARAAKTNASRAADLAEPTGNGFADDIRGRLDAIRSDQEDAAAHLIRMENKLDKVERKIDTHIGDHASADVHRGRHGRNEERP
jgi:hypothetical protein